jgi:hypothetical protein
MGGGEGMRQLSVLVMLALLAFLALPEDRYTSCRVSRKSAPTFSLKDANQDTEQIKKPIIVRMEKEWCEHVLLLLLLLLHQHCEDRQRERERQIEREKAVLIGGDTYRAAQSPISHH